MLSYASACGAYNRAPGRVLISIQPSKNTTRQNALARSLTASMTWRRRPPFLDARDVCLRPRNCYHFRRLCWLRSCDANANVIYLSSPADVSSVSSRTTPRTRCVSARKVRPHLYNIRQADTTNDYDSLTNLHQLPSTSPPFWSI